MYAGHEMYHSQDVARQDIKNFIYKQYEVYVICDTVYGAPGEASLNFSKNKGHH